MQALHVRPRRVSAQYIDRSVVVGVHRVAAFDAGKARLALAAFTVDAAALRTGQRRVGGINFSERPAALFKLVGKDRLEGEPALVQNAAVQTRFLPNALARFGYRTASACGHRGNIKPFHNNKAKSSSNAQRRLVMPIGSNASNLAKKGCDTTLRFVLAGGPLPSSSGDRLRPSPSPFQIGQRCGQRQVLPCGKRKSVNYSSINTNGNGGWFGRAAGLDLTREDNVPSVRLPTDSCAFDRAWSLTSVSKFYQPDLRYPNGTPLSVYRLDSCLAPFETKTVIVAASLKGRILRSSSEEISEGSIQVSKSLCLTGAAYCANPVKLRPQRCEFFALARKTDRAPGARAKLPVPDGSLLQGKIEDQATHASKLVESSRLICGRCELVSITAKHPAPIYRKGAANPTPFPQDRRK